jgi:hypothetical protein
LAGKDVDVEGIPLGVAVKVEVEARMNDVPRA